MTGADAAANRETFKAYVLEALKMRGMNPAHCPLAIHGILAVATGRGADARTFPRVFRVWTRWLAEADPVDLVHATRTLSAMVVLATRTPEAFALLAGRQPMRRNWWRGAEIYTRRLRLRKWRA